MSEEIKETDIRKLSVDELRTLGNVVRNTTCSLTDDLNAQQILDLYHASKEYDFIESWLEEEPTAAFQYARISGAGICALLNCENDFVVAPPGAMHFVNCKVCRERVSLGGLDEPDEDACMSDETNISYEEPGHDRERSGSDHGN